MSRKKLTEANFKKIYSTVPRLCVDLIIVKDKKFLLTKRSIIPFKGLWHFPGGSVLYRETIKQAISRVAKAELGVKVIPQFFLGYMEGLYDGYRHTISLVFRCKLGKNQKPQTLEQANKLKFFSKIPSKVIIWGQKKFLVKNWKKIID